MRTLATTTLATALGAVLLCAAGAFVPTISAAAQPTEKIIDVDDAVLPKGMDLHANETIVFVRKTPFVGSDVTIKQRNIVFGAGAVLKAELVIPDRLKDKGLRILAEYSPGRNGRASVVITHTVPGPHPVPQYHAIIVAVNIGAGKP